MQLKTPTQSFNDGVAKIYTKKNISGSGKLPKYVLTLRLENPLSYEERVVGMSRFWAASQEKTKIERLLRMPRLDTVQREDIIIPVDGQQYRIMQVQYPPNVEPKSMDLSMERLEVPYDIT